MLATLSQLRFLCQRNCVLDFLFFFAYSVFLQSRSQMSKLPFFSLMVVTLLWGLTFPLIELCMKLQDPFLFVALRFSVASIFALPFFLRRLSKKSVMTGVILGLLNCGAFITQTIGLMSVNASRAAFLTGIYVLLIPFLSPLFKLGIPRKSDVLCTILCFAGIYTLTGCDLQQITFGDVWILMSVIFIALSLVYISYVGKRGIDPFLLTNSQIVMTTVFAWISCCLFGNFDCSALMNTHYLPALLVCSLLATNIAILLQSKYQKRVSPQQAALIFSLEPVFGALFDFAIAGNRPTVYLIYGGGIILLSVVLCELWRSEEKLVDIA